MLSQHTPTPENQQEEWRPVVGWEDRYLVSPDGRVCTSDGVIKSLHLSNGYSKVNLYRNNKTYRHFVHRLVAAAFIGPLPNGYQVNHKNGNKTQNVVANLEYVTPSANAQHRNRVLGKHRNVGDIRIKLTEPEVVAIRQSPQSTHVLAQQYGVWESTISRVRKGITWRHLLPPAVAGGG